MEGLIPITKELSQNSFVMKKLTEIKIAVSYKEVVHKIVEVELPERNMYFIKGEPNEYMTDVKVFAIIQTHRVGAGMYCLVQADKNEQSSTDFIPRSDLKDSYWVENPNRLRKLAFDLITNNMTWGWKEITKEEFESIRLTLINWYEKHYEETLKAKENE